MGRGGAELRTVELMRNVDRRRYQFDFCALSGQPGELDDEIRSLGGEVHLLRAGRQDFARQLQGLLRYYQYNVVHSHLHYRSGYVLRLAAGCGVPVRVAHFRNARSPRSGTPLKRFARAVLSPFAERYAGNRTLRRWIDRHATDVLGVSRAALDSAWNPRWRTDPRCRVVYDGLEPARYAIDRDGAGVRSEFGLVDDAPLLIHVGRMTEEKNHPRLLAVMAEIARRQPAARLLIVSRTARSRREKQIEARVHRCIDRLALGVRVAICGERTDVPRLMRSADLLLFPSKSEGLGDVVLEASAAGTPALCSDLSSIGEMAARLPGIRCLPLSKSNHTWGDVAAAMLAEPPSAESRRAAWEAFCRSEFTVGECVDSLCQIWQGKGEVKGKRELKQRREAGVFQRSGR
jgi:glycosyltransferase involved in cell wall biosynthesis